jgi:hypothetical protein
MYYFSHTYSYIIRREDCQKNITDCVRPWHNSILINSVCEQIPDMRFLDNPRYRREQYVPLIVPRYVYAVVVVKSRTVADIVSGIVRPAEETCRRRDRRIVQGMFIISFPLDSLP